MESYRENRVYEYCEDSKKMYNILIYNIIQENSGLTIIVNKNYKETIKNKFQKKGIWIRDEISIVDEDEFLKNKCKDETHIIMFSHQLSSYMLIDEKIANRKCIVIGKDEKSLNENMSIENSKFLNENIKLLKYKEKWGAVNKVYDDKIKEWVLESINIAKKRIFFQCPWISEKAFDVYKKAIKDAVNRGIDVRIKYGYNKEKDERFLETKEVIDDLKIEMGDKTNLKLIEGNTHIKEILVDNFYLSGSFNFFSNSMKSENSAAESMSLKAINNEKELEEICMKY